MTTVTDTYTIFAEVIEQALNAEFGSDSPAPIIRHDRIHESLGASGRTFVGISPEVDNTQNLQLGIDILVQFYDPYSLEINPEQIVDPRKITNKAERLRRAIQSRRIVANSQAWYMDVVRVTYPNDATGNKSRFEMVIFGRGNNTGLIETSG